MNIQGESSKMRHGLGTLAPWVAALAAIWIFHLFGADSIDAYYFTIVMYSGINVILAVSLNLVNGFTGQFSMGHAGFMSIGGYVSAYLTSQVIAANPEWMTHPVFS
ncbi:MAG: branched-chain amino acid ABC transporter permease, partial [Bdellovibrionota bacterium]